MRRHRTYRGHGMSDHLAPITVKVLSCSFSLKLYVLRVAVKLYTPLNVTERCVHPLFVTKLQ